MKEPAVILPENANFMFRTGVNTLSAANQRVRFSVSRNLLS